MKKLNDKAFTMIELIAAITIMAILMLIIIPSVFGIVEKNKKTTYLNDAKQLITMAKNQYNSDPTITEPTDSLCLVFRLKDLRKSGLEKGPNGGKYNGTYSYVTINYNYNSGKYIYGVQLLEEYTTKGRNIYRGITYTKQADLQRNSIAKNTHSIDNYTDLGSLSVSSSCPNGLVFSDGSFSDGNNLDNDVKPGDILTVTYKIGFNVKKIGAETGSCTVPESKKSCTVTLPSIEPEDGYNSVGWSRTIASTSGDSKSITLTRSSSVYYANAIDKTAPFIEFSMDEDRNFTKDKQIDVKLADLGVGLDSDITIKYGWSLSNNIEPNNYTEVKPDYEKGSKEATFQAIGSDLNGDYYLWVVPINLQDLEGNERKETTVSKGIFKYNKTQPICKFTNMRPMLVGNQETLLLTCTDSEVNVISKNLAIDDFSVSSEDSGKIVSVSDPKEVANGYEYQVVVEGVGTGDFSVSFSGDKIQNEAGNMNEDLTSDKITVNGRTYSVHYALDNHVAGISGEETTCTTSGKSLECEITLPTIEPASGYYVDGWYINDTKIGTDGGYKISGDIQINAKVQEKEYTIIYNYEENGGTDAEIITSNPEDKVIKVGDQFIEIAKAGEQIIKKEENDGEINVEVKVQAKKDEEDWEFVGWNTDPNEVIALDEYYMPNMLPENDDKITLYAIFRKEKTAQIHYYNKNTGGTIEDKISCYLYNNATDDDVCNFTIPDSVEESAPEGFDFIGLLSNWSENWGVDLAMNPLIISEKDVQIENSIVYTSANPVYYAVYHKDYIVNYIKEDTVDNIEDIAANETDEESGDGEESESSEEYSSGRMLKVGEKYGASKKLEAGEESNDDENNEDIKENIIQTSLDVYLYHRTGYDTSYNIKLPKIKPRIGHTNVKWTEILDNEGTKGNIFAPEQEYTLTKSTTTFSASAEDIDKPIWSIVSVEKECNDLKITLQGGDSSGQAISNLKLNDIKILIGGKENTQQENTVLSSASPESSGFIGGTVQQVLTIKNYNQEGGISLTIAESTLKDVAGNTNEKTSLNYAETEIYDVCESSEPKWSIIRVEKNCDDLKIVLQGTSPSGKVEGNLKLENLEIQIGDENISTSTEIEKTLSQVSSESSEFIEGAVQYILTLKGYKKKGAIKISIPASTLKDEAGNINNSSLINYPEVGIYDTCESTPN